MVSSDKLTRSVNWFVSGFLVTLLISSTLMIGSNRPVFWMLNATLVLGVTSAFLFMTGIGVTKMRYPIERWQWIGVLGALYAIGLAAHLVIALAWPGFGGISSGDMALGLMRIATYGGVFFLTLQVATNVRRARKLAWAIFAAVVLISVYGLISYRVPELLLYDKDAYLKVLSGPFINRNSYATFLAMGCALGTSLALRTNRDGGMGNKKSRMDIELILARTAVFACVLILFASVLATGSRMGTFVGVLAILIPVALRIGQSQGGGAGNQAIVGISIVIVVLLSFAVVSALYGGLLFDRLGSTGMAADVRWQLYENVWKVVLDRPLFGHGLDSFEFAFRQGHELPVSPDLRWQNAHNTYLELWVELGLILGSIPPVICLVALVRLFQRAAVNQYTGYLAQAGVAVIVVGAVHSLVDFSLEMEANVFLFVMLVALGLAPNDAKIEGSRS